MAISRQVMYFSGHPGPSVSLLSELHGCQVELMNSKSVVSRTTPKSMATVLREAVTYYWQSFPRQTFPYRPTGTSSWPHATGLIIGGNHFTPDSEMKHDKWAGCVGLSWLPCSTGFVCGPGVSTWLWSLESCPQVSPTVISGGSSTIILSSQAQDHLWLFPEALGISCYVAH